MTYSISPRDIPIVLELIENKTIQDWTEDNEGRLFVTIDNDLMAVEIGKMIGYRQGLEYSVKKHKEETSKI